MDYAKEYYRNQIEPRAYDTYLTIDEMKKEFTMFRNTVLFRVTEGSDIRTRDIYQILIGQLTAFDPMQWLDTPEVFISTADIVNKKMRIPWFGLAGTVLLIAMVIRFVLTKTMADVITAILIGLGLAAFLTQLVLLWMSLSAKPKTNIRCEQRVSSVKFKAGLEQLANTLDSNAESLYRTMNAPAAVSGSTADTDVSIVLDLLSFSFVQDNPVIMNVIDHYLMKHKITKLDYSEQYAHLFEVMPSDITKTKIPVLVKDEKILNRGTVLMKMEGM